MLLQAAQRGQLGGKVTEDALIKMLEQINGEEVAAATASLGGPKITMTRRRNIMTTTTGERGKCCACDGGGARRGGGHAM